MTPEGRERLEASARYRKGADAQVELSQAATNLATAINDATILFGPMARDLAVKAAAQIGKGPRPERSNQTSVGVLGTMLVSAATMIGVGVFDTIVGGGLAATQLVGAMQQGVTIMATAAGSFIVENAEALRAFAASVGPELTWLRQLAEWIIKRRGGMRQS